MRSEDQCGACGTPIVEPSSTHNAERQRCPSCGSTVRKNVEIAASLTFRDSFSFKLKSASGRILAEGFSGYDIHHDSKRWMQKERLIDRERNWYREIVVDPETHLEIHRCEEPLTEHRGHGFAKQKSP